MKVREMIFDWRYLNGGPRERLIRKIAWALPRELVKWCAVRLMVHATVGEYSNQSVPDLTTMDALKRWEGSDD